MRLLHVTDTHLVSADARDDKRKQKLAEDRKACFHDENGRIERFLEEQIRYAEEHCDLLVHTGDLMDFLSAANIEKARTVLENRNIFFIAGNHDYSRYVGEAWEDETYRMNSYMKMGYGLGVPMFYNARTVGGINLVGIDNSYYRFADWQIWRLRQEIRKGLPILLALHDPLFEPALYAYHRKVSDSDCTYLVGCDEEHLASYTEFRAVQQRPDPPTLQMIDVIRNEPQICGILTGHLHFSFESLLREKLPQFVTGPGYEGVAREVLIE